LKDKKPDIVALKNAILEVEQRLGALDTVQAELEMIVPENEMMQCINDAADFRDSKLPTLLQGRRVVDELNEDNTSTSSTSTQSNQNSRVYLPQLNLGKFDGDVENWQAFWDKYTAVIHDTEMPAVAKFSYLVAALEGEAQQVIRGISVTEANYPVACELLKERFGRPERIIFAHIQALLSLQPLTPGQRGKSYISALWKQQDVILSHTRSLEVLGVKEETCGVFLTPLILSRLLSDIRLEWAREGEGKEADLGFLLTFLQKEIQRLERSEAFKEDTVQQDTAEDFEDEKWDSFEEDSNV
jgi:hypothetical protein